MPRRGENIYKRKDGRWEGRYIKSHIDGKSLYGYVYAYTYSDVKEKLSKAKTQTSDQQLLNIVTNEKENQVLFFTVSSEWLNFQSGKVKRSSYVKYLNTLTSYIIPVFSSQEIEKISRSDIISLCTVLSETGGSKKTGLSSKTIADILSIMRSIFDYASNVKGLSVPNIRGISVNQSQPSMRVLSSGEQYNLEVYLRDNLTPFHMGILVCLYTGLRIGELCALTWGDISSTEQTLYVHKTMQRLQIPGALDRKTEIIISSPKSACSIRKIPLPESIYQLMSAYRECDETYLLTGSKTKYMEPRTVEKKFKRILEKAGVDPANFHALRHSFATRCIEVGFDVKSLSEILGHASVNITLNRYVHPSMSMKQKNMNLLSELFSVK